MPPWETRVRALAAFGRIIGTFDQTNRFEALGKPNAKWAIGYCTGCCFDWIRRVLNGGRPQYAMDPNKTYDEDFHYRPRITEQTVRMMATFKTFQEGVDTHNVAVKAHAEALSNYSQRLAAKNSAATRQNDVMSLRNTLIELHGQRGVTSVSIDPDLRRQVKQHLDRDLPETVSKNELGRVITALAGVRDGIRIPELLPEPRKPGSSPFSREEDWKSLFRKFDASSADLRSRLGRAPAKHLFSSLQVVEFGYNKPYANTQAVMDAVAAFTPVGAAARINWTMNSGSHAVALHRTQSGDLFFFDPNHGIFKYAKFSDVQNAIDYLFLTIYPEPLGPFAGTIDYEVFRA